MIEFTQKKMMEGHGAKSFVTIMIAIAVSALVIRTVVGALINMNMGQNESNAEGTLKLIAASLENYANDHRDKYPSDFSALTQSNPPYLDKDYVTLSSLKGYLYGCSRLETAGYNCFARPTHCGLTGRTTYSVTTGGQLASESCQKNE
ncbi:MAG: hypothetical protein AMJ95_03560 [Omnitrophica WOR_2 bacterium SM23_72]|nr:MAG: hypothetical protein AMJ95_03560 [Omnitrophica WOR_2 bacterium SM23_72]